MEKEEIKFILNENLILELTIISEEYEWREEAEEGGGE